MPVSRISLRFPKQYHWHSAAGSKDLRSYYAAAAAAVQGPPTADRLGYFNRECREAQNDLLQRLYMATG